MANPLRVQKGEAGYDVSITRPGPWGNPFVIGVHGTRAEVIAKYAEWLPKQPELMARLPELRGKVLGCACRADQKCHGDVLVSMTHGRDEWKKQVAQRWENEPSNWPEDMAAALSETLAVTYYDQATSENRKPESASEVYLLETS